MKIKELLSQLNDIEDNTTSITEKLVETKKVLLAFFIDYGMVIEICSCKGTKECAKLEILARKQGYHINIRLGYRWYNNAIEHMYVGDSNPNIQWNMINTLSLNVLGQEILIRLSKRFELLKDYNKEYVIATQIFEGV